MAMLNDGRLITSGWKHRAALWDIGEFKRLQTIGEGQIGRSGLVVSADGSRFACHTGDRRIGVYDVLGWKLLYEVCNPDDKHIGSFALSQDGRMIAVSMHNVIDVPFPRSVDYELIIGNVDEQRVFWRTELNRPALWMAFLPGTTRVVTTMGDKFLRLVDYQTKTMDRLHWNINAGLLCLLDEGRHALLTGSVQGKDNPIWSWGVWETGNWKSVHFEETGMGVDG